MEAVRERRPCAVCGKGATKVCVCKLVRYCSRECQVMDWHSRHRYNCLGSISGGDDKTPGTPEALEGLQVRQAGKMGDEVTLDLVTILSTAPSTFRCPILGTRYTGDPSKVNVHQQDPHRLGRNPQAKDYTCNARGRPRSRRDNSTHRCQGQNPPPPPQRSLGATCRRSGAHRSKCSHDHRRFFHDTTTTTRFPMHYSQPRLYS